MQDLDLAYIVHRTPTRVRIRIPSRRNDADFLAFLSRQLRAVEGIASVEGNASTASVVIKSERDFDWARLWVSDFSLAVASSPGVAASAGVGLRVSATLAAARLPGQVGVSEYGSGRADLSEFVVQLAPLVLTREPASALLHWMVQAVLKSLCAAC
jgi:hypothetical protein